MASGLRDVSVTLGARMAAFAPTLAIQSCLAWFLEPAGRGSYAVGMMFASMLTVLCMFGVDAAGQYFIASRRCSVSQGVSATLFMEAFGGLAAVAIGLAAMTLPIELFDRAPRSVFVVSVLLAPFQIWSTTLLLLLTTVRAFTYRAAVSLAAVIVRLLGTIAMVYGLGWGVEGAVGANIAASIVTIVAVFVFLRRRCALQWIPPTLRRIGELCAYGLRYFPASLSNQANMQIGVLVLAFFVEGHQIGLFSAGVALVMNVVMIPDVVATVIHPRVAIDPAGRPELTAQCIRVVAIVCVSIILAIVIFAKPIVTLLLSPEFLDSVPILWIVAPGAAIRATVKVIVPYLNGTDHPGIFSIATVCGLLSNLVLLIALLPILGLTGAAWAMTGGAVVNGLILVLAFRKLSGLTYAQTWCPTTADWDVFVEVWRKWRERTSQGPV